MQPWAPDLDADLRLRNSTSFSCAASTSHRPQSRQDSLRLSDRADRDGKTELALKSPSDCRSRSSAWIRRWSIGMDIGTAKPSAQSGRGAASSHRYYSTRRILLGRSIRTSTLPRSRDCGSRQAAACWSVGYSSVSRVIARRVCGSAASRYRIRMRVGRGSEHEGLAGVCIASAGDSIRKRRHGSPPATGNAFSERSKSSRSRRTAELCCSRTLRQADVAYTTIAIIPDDRDVLARTNRAVASTRWSRRVSSKKLRQFEARDDLHARRRRCGPSAIGRCGPILTAEYDWKRRGEGARGDAPAREASAHILALRLARSDWHGRTALGRQLIERVRSSGTAC